MKTTEAIRAGAGALVIYVVMAACSGNEPTEVAATKNADAGSSPSGAGGSIEGGQSGATTNDSGFFDVLLDPVARAEAASTPEMATEPCDKVYTPGTPTYYYAEHAFPGRTAADLAGLRIMGHLMQFAPSPNLQYQSSDFYFADGVASVFCGDSLGQRFDKVTFILPM